MPRLFQAHNSSRFKRHITLQMLDSLLSLHCISRSIRSLRLHLHDQLQNFLDDLVTLCIPSLLYSFHLLLSIFLRILLRLLVAVCVLTPNQSSLNRAETRVRSFRKGPPKKGRQMRQPGRQTDLFFELVKLLVFLLSIIFYLLLCFILGVFYAL